MPESLSKVGDVVAQKPRRRRLTTALFAVAMSAACSTATDGERLASSDMADMPGMGMEAAPSTPAVADAEPSGTGLSDTMGGYSFVLAGVTAPGTFSFRISGPDGRAVTRYQPYESRFVVLSVVRSDLSGYSLLDPAMRQDGTWTARLPALPPGAYRAFATFAAPDSSQGLPLRYTLSQAFTVPGQAGDVSLPSATTTTQVDGFTVTWNGLPRVGVPEPLGVSISSGGKPVRFVDRFLDGYVHLTAFHAGDLAFARILSTGKDSAGTLTANAVFPRSGTWRLFAQFQVAGQLHTAAFTVVVPAGQ